MSCFSSPSRREVLVIAAATVTLPMLDSALGTVRSVEAAAATEKSGWLTTTIKPADLKDKEFAAVADHPIILSRSDKVVAALTNVCTHKGCAIPPTAGANILTCPCHKAAFNLDGSVSKAPATAPLTHHAIRVNDKGFLEIDPSQKLAKDDKGATYKIS
jgi:cytochrome b6-f complex iron-sulfur subunit